MNKVFGLMSFIAYLREIYEIYRKNFSSLIAIAAIGEGPILLLVSISGKIESTTLLIAVRLIAFCCLIVAFPLMIGALIHAVSEQYVRQTISIGRSYNFAWKRVSSLIGSTLLTFLAILIIAIIGITIGFLLGSIGRSIGIKINIGAFIPLIIILVIFYIIFWSSFMWEAALLEGLSSKAAVLRSFTLLRKNWWRICGRMFVLFIIIVPIIAILGKISGIGEIVGRILSTPFLVIGHVLVYYDLRLRKEGYSVETLAGELNIKPDLRITKVWEYLSNEALTLYQQGQFSEAAQRLQDGLKAAEFALGPEHLDVAAILRNLAGLFEAQGKYANAEPLYRRSFKIKEKSLGSDHPEVAAMLENMAKCYKEMGRQNEAEKLEARAKRIRSKR